MMAKGLLQYRFLGRAAVAGAMVMSVAGTAAAQVVREATAADAAGIQAAVTAFRADLGDPNNGATAGSQPGGRREINWDGGGGAAANVTLDPSPMTRFGNRGSVFTTPGSGFETSGQPMPEFGEINATYPDLFIPFSSPRLFTALNSGVMDVWFFVPGNTNVPAAVTGFGAVFTDVDREDSTKMEFYAPDGRLLYERFVPAWPGNASLSFLGVSFNRGELVGRVRIVSGNAALGPDEAGSLDLVAMDDSSANPWRCRASRSRRSRVGPSEPARSISWSGFRRRQAPASRAHRCGSTASMSRRRSLRACAPARSRAAGRRSAARCRRDCSLPATTRSRWS
jgi:hypothetical protein